MVMSSFAPGQEELGYLLTELEHRALVLTPKAAQVLYHGQRVQMLVQKEDKAPDRTNTIVKLSEEEVDLYDALWQLREKLAQKAAIPAYIVFSNATLQDMARKKPKSMTDFKRVFGVGELKASWYGQAFLDRTREYYDLQKKEELCYEIRNRH